MTAFIQSDILNGDNSVSAGSHRRTAPFKSAEASGGGDINNANILEYNVICRIAMQHFAMRCKTKRCIAINSDVL